MVLLLHCYIKKFPLEPLVLRGTRKSHFFWPNEDLQSFFISYLSFKVSLVWNKSSFVLLYVCCGKEQPFTLLLRSSRTKPEGSPTVFGNGRTHTGEVVRSGGSRLANYYLRTSPLWSVDISLWRIESTGSKRRFSDVTGSAPWVSDWVVLVGVYSNNPHCTPQSQSSWCFYHWSKLFADTSRPCLVFILVPLWISLCWIDLAYLYFFGLCLPK